MPAPTLVGASVVSQMQKGISDPESGIRVRTVANRYEDPKLYAQDEFGSRDGFAHGYDPFATCRIDGEYAGGLSVTFGVAATLANAPGAAYGVTPGGLYLENIEETENRDGWMDISAEFIAIEGLA